MTARDWLKEQREIEWTLAISGGPDEPCVHVKRTALLPVSSFAKAEQLADGADKALEAVLELHRRRPWEEYKDFTHIGQTEFPDQCDHCRRAYPCMTVDAITAALEATP